MKLPLIYNVRNVCVRWRSSIASVVGIALVVAIFIVVQSLAAGLEASSMATGDAGNLLVVRRGATAESTSQITPEQFRILRYLPGIASDTAGNPLASADLSLVINADRADTGEANATVRGVSPAGRLMRGQVQLIAGRWFEPGHREVVISSRLARRFRNMEIGDRLVSGPVTLHVVGHFDAGRTAFDSEIWMDADEARTAFERENYSSVLLRSIDGVAFGDLSARLETDKRFKLRAISERAYYSEQTKSAIPIKVLGSFLATTMSIGAVFAAMNTMYASVGARTREIGTLRVLGYRRMAILAGFLIEGALMALAGGLLGCLFALPMNGYSTGTISFETFSEAVFDFRITPVLVLQGLGFSILVGFAGSLLPAIRAARLPVIAALRSV